MGFFDKKRQREEEAARRARAIADEAEAEQFRRWREQEQAELAEKRARALAEARQRRHGFMASANDQVLVGLDLCKSIVQTAEESHLWQTRASNHFESRAFTPFWEAIESSLVSLGALRRHIDSLANASNEYRHQVSLVAKEDCPDPAEPLPFPAGLRSSDVKTAAEDIAHQLNDLVYKAQSDFEFASIFEQRRTTAAVVEGFDSLTSAVEGMGASIASSVRSLSYQLGDLQQEISVGNRSLDSLTEHVTRPVASFSIDPLSTEGQLRQVNDHLADLVRRV